MRGKGEKKEREREMGGRRREIFLSRITSSNKASSF